MKKLGLNIVLLGDSASGKNTQAEILAKKYALKFIETGLYSRKLLNKKGEKGVLARKTVGKGQALPVALLKEFLIKEINKKPKKKDLLFLGGPRLKPEAQLLNKIMKKRKEDFLVIYLTLSEKEIYKRSFKRRKMKKIKDVYKVLDTKKIIKRRIKYYKIQVSKTVKYFESLGKLKKIDGNQPIKKVAKDIEKEIQKYKLKLTSRT